MEITSTFKMAFIFVVIMTIFSFIGIAVLAVLGNDTPDPTKVSVMQQNFYATCNFGWQAGIGAILGLLGGKAA